MELLTPALLAKGSNRLKVGVAGSLQTGSMQ